MQGNTKIIFFIREAVQKYNHKQKNTQTMANKQYIESNVKMTQSENEIVTKYLSAVGGISVFIHSVSVRLHTRSRFSGDWDQPVEDFKEKASFRYLKAYVDGESVYII
jgi:hypothetical protein